MADYAAEFGLEIAPNPASSQITFSWRQAGGAACVAEILDMSGAVVWSGDVEMSPATDRAVLQLDLAVLRLSNGSYMFNVYTNEGKKASKRFVVAK